MAGKRRDVILFDASARPFNATRAVSAWRGSSRESRRARAWEVTSASINALLSGDVAELRRRSRDMMRKSPWAESALDSYAANAVGNGIVPRPVIEDDFLRREVNEAWEEFVENSDADGTMDFYGQQALVCKSHREGGDLFARFRPRRPSDGLPIPLQIQLLEAEYVDPSYEEILGGSFSRIQAGIEFDALNRRTAYWMFREHPGDLHWRSGERVRVPANQVMHVFHVQRPGQIRGVPIMAAGLAKLYELEKYDDAEIMRKQIAAMFAGFVLKPAPDADNPIDGEDEQEQDEDGTDIAAIEPGTMQALGPGEDVKFSEPADVGQSYSPFMTHQLRQVAASGRVTYEQMTGDLTGVNFSSIRAGMIEAFRRLAQYQRNTLIFQFCRPTWRRFIEAAVLSGRIPMPRDAREMRQLFRVNWTPTPGREYVDPEKEVAALIAKIRAGLISRSRAVAEHGYDVEQLDLEIALDNARADKLNLRFDCDARQPAPGARTGRSGGPRGRKQPREEREEADDGGAEEEE